MSRLLAAAALSAGLIAQAAPAAAQGAIVHGAVFAAASQGHTSAAVSGGVLYRFNRVLGLGVEATHIPGVASPAPRAPRPRFGDDDGRATLFTTNVRLELPTVWRRAIPFAVAGGGVGAVTERYDVVYARLAELGLSILPGPPTVESTTVNMALTLGGGISLLMTDHVSADADFRVITLLGGADRNIGRFGAGLSYRF